MIEFRLAVPSDSAAILRIYAQYIETPVTFEYGLPTVKAFSERIRNITEVYPYIVCISGNKIIGYAYAHRQKEREAYGWNAELSIYLDSECAHMGIGRQLYSKLIALLKFQGIRSVYAGVTVPNAASDALHRSFGFRCAGTYYRTGYKASQWRDVSWYELELSEDDSEPLPLVPITDIPKSIIESVLK